MCINKKRFFNKWTHSWQWIDCGKCEACLQHKAMLRTRRIKNASWNGYVTMFVTLTYRNINIPYIRKDELTSNTPYLNVYRDCSVRRVRSDSDYHIGYKYVRERKILERHDLFENRLFIAEDQVKRLKKLKGQSDTNKVGVLYYKDLQDFTKRLRINLQRWYGITKPLYFWNCSEIGPTTQRPHFHLLISVPQESMVECSRSIISSWPYDSRIGTDKGIQIARNAASYVSSYVNRPSDFPSLFSHRLFRPKHSFSIGYGRQHPAFACEKICDAIRRSDLRFASSRSSKDGSAELSFVLYPKYALTYYFPKFTGYSRLTYSEIYQFIQYPESIYSGSLDLIKLFPSTEVNPFTQEYEYDWKKIRYLVSQVQRCYKRFITDFVYYENEKKFVGLPDNSFSRGLYADYLWHCWIVYASTLYKIQFENVPSLDEQFEFYDNWDEVLDKIEWIPDGVLVCDPNPLFHGLNTRSTYNPNQFRRNIEQNFYYTDLYYRCLKQKKVTNSIECKDRNV